MTDEHGIPSMGNFSPRDDGADSGDVLNESRWEIPNLDGIDFGARAQQDIENTQSLTQLSEHTSSALHSLQAEEKREADEALKDPVGEAQPAQPAQPAEETQSFDPLAEFADEPEPPAEPVAPATAFPVTVQQPAPAAVAERAETPESQSALDELDEFAEYEQTNATGSLPPVTGAIPAVQPAAPDSLRSSHRSPKSEEAKQQNSTNRFLIIGVVSVLVLALIIGFTIFFRNTASAATHEQLLNTCTQSRQAATQSSASLNTTISDAQSVADTQSADVEDTAVLTKAKNAIDQAKASIENEKNLDSCATEMTDNQLRSLADNADKIVANQKTYTTTISQTKSAVEKSKQSKTQATAKNSLTAKRQEAQSLYEQSKGKVTDETTRENLKKAIDAADELIAQSTKKVTADQYSAAVETLTNTITAVQNSMKTYEEQEAKKKAEEERKNVAGICSAYAGTYSSGATQFTLRGDCSLQYGDSSTGTPTTCTFADGSSGACATVDNEDNPSRINWSIACSAGSEGAATGTRECQNANVTLSRNGAGASINVGGQSFTRQ
ncbi:hypothetical protein [Alloscardovia macacae]|uniref:Uncharacterized protein n=1 Tax=Alloscardovia macacae TaxID=1160091 RepID=A0A261F652_9BIFI|nr:hypothetical protein [Alloscardovia macacae]OZG54555.1 hypothetical protein ALMA_0502 [Alloscardovia macacae]